jgi:hypothetical protein
MQAIYYSSNEYKNALYEIDAMRSSVVMSAHPKRLGSQWGGGWL